VVNAYSDILSPLAVDAVLQVVDIQQDFNVDLNNIKIAKKLGGTVEDTMLVQGLCFSS
jgi:T-complex protein 1 subunit delta